MRGPLLTVLRLLVVVVQMTALMAYFLEYLYWGIVPGMLWAFLVSLFLPLVATVLAVIGAVQVWAWPWWAALLIFLPGLMISFTALAGVGLAGLLSALLFRRVRARGGPFAEAFARARAAQGQADAAQARSGRTTAPHDDRTIEGEVISSRVDNDK